MFYGIGIDSSEKSSLWVHFLNLILKLAVETPINRFWLEDIGKVSLEIGDFELERSPQGVAIS